MEILQLQFQVEIALTIGFAILILLIMFICFLQFYLDLRKQSKDLLETATLECSQCHTSFQLPLAYFIEHPFLLKKDKRIQLGGIKRLTSRQYHLTCPKCHRKTWCSYDLENSTSILACLRKGMWKKHLIRFVLLECAVFIFYILLMQLYSVFLF